MLLTLSEELDATCNLPRVLWLPQGAQFLMLSHTQRTDIAQGTAGTAASSAAASIHGWLGSHRLGLARPTHVYKHNSYL